ASWGSVSCMDWIAHVFGWSQGHLSSPLSRGIATLQLFAFENAFFKLKALLHTAVDVVTPSCECSSRARRRRAAVAAYRAHQDRLALATGFADHRARYPRTRQA